MTSVDGEPVANLAIGTNLAREPNQGAVSLWGRAKIAPIGLNSRLSKDRLGSLSVELSQL
jgi:hypothetical protein